MAGIDPLLVDRYAVVIEFLKSHPGVASTQRGAKISIGSAEYIQRKALGFAADRTPKSPVPPSTVPDEVVSVILHQYYNVEEDRLEDIKRTHSLSMAAENLIGELLERYLATLLEPKGWVWCSGSVVRAVDFIQPPTAGGVWQLLQVKNRDNSENSSSSAIRHGTTIKKWFRTFSRTGRCNWEAFPEESVKGVASEQGFRSFVGEYVRGLRQ